MTEEAFQSRVLSELASMRVEHATTHKAVKRLEDAVLGNPETGTDGLVTRMRVVESDTAHTEENTPGKSRRAVINTGAGVAGGTIVAIIMELLPVLKELTRGS